MSKYDDIITGDVVLLSSITPFAVLVKWGTASEYNHVAVAVRIEQDFLPKIKVIKTGGILCLIEFNGDDFKNIITSEIHHGNRLVLFSDLISKYKKISYRRLKSEHYTINFEKNIEDFIYKYCNHITQMDKYTPIMNVFGISVEQRNADEAPKFCSELTAKFYGDLIPLSINIPYNKHLPSHFGGNRYNNIFEDQTTDAKDEHHCMMDFFDSPLFWIIVILLIILLFIYCTRKIYKVYCDKNKEICFVSET